MTIHEAFECFEKGIKVIFDGNKEGYIYLDENGITTNNTPFCDKENLLKKHENEFIDVEVK